MFLPQRRTIPTTSSHQKRNTRRERSTQGLTKDPVQQRPRRPLHAIERPAKEPSATKARSRRRVPTATHSVRPQKHERRAQEGATRRARTARGRGRRLAYQSPNPALQAPHQSANPRRRRTTSVPTTTTENATARAASTPSRGKRPPEPAPVPRAKRATARSTPVAPLAQARRRRVTCLELADRFPTAKPLGDGRTEPFRTSRRARWCAARGPSRRT